MIMAVTRRISERAAPRANPRKSRSPQPRLARAETTAEERDRLAAGIILAIMIVPFITAVSREVLLAVPNTQREAALGLGATRWETTRIAVLRYGKSGLIGAVLLGLGRALGETMAVTMVIGNRPEVAISLFAPGYTMASVIANEFTEATSDLYLGALIEIGLLLFAVTVIVNALARLLVWSVGGAVKQVRE